MAILDLLVLTSLSDSESVNIKYFQVINKGRRQKKQARKLQATLVRSYRLLTH